MKTLFHIILIILLPLAMYAQQGMYIAPGTRVQVFSTEPVSIFGNVNNDGAFGSNKSSQINFYGKAWTNGNGSTMPDESTDGFSGKGGMFRFSGNNPLYGNLGAQQVFAGYSVAAHTGATFPNFEVNNRLGVLMADLSDMKVRHQLHFSAGHIFLNGWNLVVGDRQPGSITGYNEESFIVTGTSIGGGFLYREQVKQGDGKIVFPIGSSISGYAPAAIEFAGTTPDDFRARVFDSVYQYATSGKVNRLDFTNKTWNLARQQSSDDDVKVTLQHMDVDEGIEYRTYRGSSYLSRFINNTWDYQETADNFPLAGNLTTTGTLRNATMHMRNFQNGLKPNEYFAKASVVYGPYAPGVFIDLAAWRINDNFAQLEWAVSREVNNDHFEIQRRFDTDTGFIKVADVASRAPGGNIDRRVDYAYNDANNYHGWTYYRIRAVSRNGRESYSATKALPPFLKIEAWPNPSFGDFKVSVRGEQTEMLMQIVNISNQVVNQYYITGGGSISVKGLTSGLYTLAFYDRTAGRFIRSYKVIVLSNR